MEQQTKITEFVVLETPLGTSMTPISTKIPWDSFLFKPVFELE